MRLNQQTVVLAATLLVGTCFLPTALPAADESNYWLKNDRFGLAVGAYDYRYDTNTRHSSDDGTIFGTVIDLEEDLNLDDEGIVPFVQAYFRIAARHRIDLQYYDLSRDSNAVTTGQINFGNLVINVGVPVRTTFDYRVLDLNYGYSLYQTERTDFALLGGVYWVFFESEMRELMFQANETEEITAPLPTLGARFVHRISDRWRFNSRVSYLDANYGDIAGRILNFTGGVEYKPWRRVALGLAYSIMDISGEENKRLESVDFNYDGRGWSLYAKVQL